MKATVRMSVTVLSAVDRMILTNEKMNGMSNISRHDSWGLGTITSSSDPRDEDGGG
jgi:hypothetical protein